MLDGILLLLGLMAGVTDGRTDSDERVLRSPPVRKPQARWHQREAWRQWLSSYKKVSASTVPAEDKEACIGNCTTFESLYGDCSTYSATFNQAEPYNYPYCDEDTDATGLVASQVCPQCLECSSTECPLGATPPAPPTAPGAPAAASASPPPPVAPGTSPPPLGAPGVPAAADADQCRADFNKTCAACDGPPSVRENRPALIGNATACQLCFDAINYFNTTEGALCKDVQLDQAGNDVKLLIAELALSVVPDCNGTSPTATALIVHSLGVPQVERVVDLIAIERSMAST